MRRLAGGTGQWRLRVGEWRVRYVLDYSEQVIDVLYIGPRGDAYRP